MGKKEIVFWGADPPPIGGMTVHIKRLSEFLLANDWRVFQYNFNKNVNRDEIYIINIKNVLIWYLKLWVSKSSNIHYVITTTAFVRFLAALLTLRGKKIILRVGGRSLENDLRRGGINKILNILSLKLCTAFIGVNERICNQAKRYTNNQKIHHITGFIPPSNIVKTPIIIEEYFKTDYLKIVITGQIVNEENEDIYGLYHALDALALAKDRGVKFKCCIVSYTISGDNSICREEFKRKINALELDNQVLLYHNEGELWPILKVCDLFIRTSITDGDANSIREALFLNKNVIASDCVVRPKECLVYKTSNSNDLALKIGQIRERKFLNDEKNATNDILILQLLNTLRIKG